MIRYNCPECNIPVNAKDTDAGHRGPCPSCKADIVTPHVSTRSDKPITVQATRIGQKTYSIRCPHCGAKRNFRESSLGTTIRCNNCRVKLDLHEEMGGLATEQDKYSLDDLMRLYRRYAELKGWNTSEEVVRDKVEGWVACGLGPVGLAIDFHEGGVDKAKHLGYNAEERATGSPIQLRVLTLAGTDYDNADGTSRQEAVQQCQRLEALRLIREPDNLHDPNAVAVLRSGGRQLGYLPRRIAAETVRQMREGYKHVIVVMGTRASRGLRLHIGQDVPSSPQDLEVGLFILAPWVKLGEWAEYFKAWRASQTNLE